MNQVDSGQDRGPMWASSGAVARYGLFSASGLFLFAAVWLWAYDVAGGALALLALAAVTALEGATNKRGGARATNLTVLTLLVGLLVIALVWAVFIVG
jgi:hypothetical protein